VEVLHIERAALAGLVPLSLLLLRVHHEPVEGGALEVVANDVSLVFL